MSDQDQTNDIQPADTGAGRRRKWLQLKFVAPIVGVMLVAIVAIALMVSYFNSQTQNQSLIHERIAETRKLAESMLDKGIQFDADAMQAMVYSVARDERLADLFKSRNRAALLAYAQPLYKRLSERFQITHFYFLLPDRVTFLRVHTPARHGDVTDRQTALLAEKTDRMTSGVEMGPLGTLTLRVVYPWHDRTGQLIGYLELGKEIDHVVHDLQDSTGLNGYLLLHKAMLNEKLWFDGMAALGRQNNWADYPELVEPSGRHRQADEQITTLFQDHLALHQAAPPGVVIDGRSYQPVLIPVQDMNHRNVGDLVILADVTFLRNAARNTLVAALLMVLLSGIPILYFFNRQAKKLQAQLESNERELNLRANTDALTGLLNRRSFDSRLAEELLRSERYEHDFCLMIIDIDLFKRINDTYGHQEGDKVLQEMADRLRENVRATDAVFRYGGEELAVILPETDLGAAMELAVRINKAIGDPPFMLNRGQSPESITVSIGVAAYPDNAHGVQTLIRAADAALYKAKNTGRNRVVSA